MNKLLLGAAIAALASAIPAAAPAQRLGGAVVAVVDTARIYRECTACKAAQTQIQNQANQLRTRAQALETPLRTEATSIQQAMAALKGRAPDAALTQRIQAIQTKQNAANQEIDRGEQNIRSIQANVLQQLNNRLRPIINQVMQSRGANIVVDAGATLAQAPSLDVTNDVLAQLNQQLPSVSVTPLPQQQQQPQGR
jgi:Skp family chaperone for outer membrane proteins